VGGVCPPLQWCGTGCAPSPENFFWNFQVKNAGFCAFLLRKTACVHKPGPGGGLIGSIEKNGDAKQEQLYLGLSFMYASQEKNGGFDRVYVLPGGAIDRGSKKRGADDREAHVWGAHAQSPA